MKNVKNVKIIKNIKNLFSGHIIMVKVPEYKLNKTAKNKGIIGYKKKAKKRAITNYLQIKTYY